MSRVYILFNSSFLFIYLFFISLPLQSLDDSKDIFKVSNSQDNQTPNPPWATNTTNTTNTNNQWQQYSSDQSYSNYYGQYAQQTPEQQQSYYHQYYQAQYNPPPPGTNYDYSYENYSQYQGYYQQQPQTYSQEAAATPPPPPPPAAAAPAAPAQQQQSSYYNRYAQRPPASANQYNPPPPTNNVNRMNYSASNVQQSGAGQTDPSSQYGQYSQTSQYGQTSEYGQSGHYGQLSKYNQPNQPKHANQPQPPGPPGPPGLSGANSIALNPHSKFKSTPPVSIQINKPPTFNSNVLNDQLPSATPSPTTSTQNQTQNQDGLSAANWPPSLKRYVEDVFDCCNPARRDQVESQLRNLIMESVKAGTLLTTDWSEMDLPSACSVPKQKKKKSKKNNQHQGPNRPMSAEEEAKKLRRLRRFEEDKAQFKAENITTPPTHMEGVAYENRTVVGTSTKLEKQYLRLTSAPDPATVRPLAILKQTLALLKDKWKVEQNYTYICDQFKSMRQDLTVQRIKNEFTVEVYEIHARIALEKGDLGEYNQCQTQLKGLYSSGIEGKVMEFTAYRILYFLHTQNWADVNATMAELTIEQKADEFVQHALQVRSSLATSNYHRFFQLYNTAPNMGGYLMDQFVERERVQSLIILCKACRPDLSLDFIQHELSFDDPEALLKFLTEQKACILKDNLNFLDTRAAHLGLVESSRKYKKIDIKGQL